MRTGLSNCTCFGNIPFPPPERSYLDREEYFITAQIGIQFAANCARRSQGFYYIESIKQKTRLNQASFLLKKTFIENRTKSECVERNSSIVDLNLTSKLVLEVQALGQLVSVS